MLRFLSACGFEAECVVGDLYALWLTIWTGYRHRYHWTTGITRCK